MTAPPMAASGNMPGPHPGMLAPGMMMAPITLPAASPGTPPTTGLPSMPIPSNPTTSPSPVLPQGAGLPGGGPPKDLSDGGDDGDDAQTSTESSARTSALRSALRRRAREQDRPKTSIGSVRIEEYHGDRRKFLRWRRAVEAQEKLYKLDPAELSMLVYLSTRGEARDVLDQRPLAEFTSHDGLRLFAASAGGGLRGVHGGVLRAAERELNAYRRLPGQSISTSVAAMKRLKAQYVATDPDTTFRDRSWAQRLLNRASLGRRERLDVFYSAGGLYVSDAIEKALRHRCAHIHEYERKVPGGGSLRSDASTRTGRTFSRASSTSSSSASTWSSCGDGWLQPCLGRRRRLGSRGGP